MEEINQEIERWRLDVRLGTFLERATQLDPEEINTGWEDVLIAEGMTVYGHAFDDQRALDWVQKWLDYHVATPIVEEKLHVHTGMDVQGIRLCDYCGNWGFPLASIYKDGNTCKTSYSKETIQVADYIITGSPRWSDGIMRHCIGAGVWVDTLYYAAAPLAKAYALTGDARYADEAMKQCLLHEKHLKDRHTGLFFHDRTLETKVRSTSFWGRGQGWIIMSLAEVLYYIDPSDHGVDETVYSCIQEIYQDLVGDLLRYKDSSGLWRTVPENEESPLETSASIMITIGIVKGIASGVLEPSLVVGVTKSLYEIISYIHVRPDRPLHGALMGSQHAAGVGGWEVHKTISTGEITYTTGLFLKLLGEMKLIGAEVPINI